MSDTLHPTDFHHAGSIEVRYPETGFRPVPRFSIDIPGDWGVIEFADALFAMGTPVDSQDPWSNVIVHHERVWANTTLEEIAQVSFDELQTESPDVVVKEELMLGLELFHYVREVELTMPGVNEPVTRFDTFCFGTDVDHPTVDLFQITWLHPTAAGEERKALYLQMLATFHIEE